MLLLLLLAAAACCCCLLLLLAAVVVVAAAAVAAASEAYAAMVLRMQCPEPEAETAQGEEEMEVEETRPMDLADQLQDIETALDTKALVFVSFFYLV